MNIENEYPYDRNLKFHCHHRNGKLVILDYCEIYCKRNNKCDIYITMLNEINKK